MNHRISISLGVWIFQRVGIFLGVGISLGVGMFLKRMFKCGVRMFLRSGFSRCKDVSQSADGDKPRSDGVIIID